MSVALIFVRKKIFFTPNIFFCSKSIECIFMYTDIKKQIDIKFCSKMCEKQTLE